MYHLMSADHAISSIALGRIKVAKFSELNDPFELLGIRSVGSNTRAALDKFKVDADREARLLCFSADWTSPVLWSHYGDRHRGICLGFNLSRKRATWVKYASDRIRSTVAGGEPLQSFDEAIKRFLMCTKFQHWSYEEEIRALVPLDRTVQEGNLSFLNFDSKLALAEVILGPECRMSLAAIRQLTSANHTDAVTYASRLAHNWYSVVPNESTVP